MGGMQGDALAEELRATREDIPIILCTGYSERVTPETAAAAGMDAFLYKPIEPKELGAAIRRVLDRRRGQDAG